MCLLIHTRLIIGVYGLLDLFNDDDVAHGMYDVNLCNCIKHGELESHSVSTVALEYTASW